MPYRPEYRAVLAKNGSGIKSAEGREGGSRGSAPSISLFPRLYRGKVQVRDLEAGRLRSLSTLESRGIRIGG